MGRRYYSRRHYQRLANGGPDTPEELAERIRRRKAGELAVADRERKYPDMTKCDVREALAYQEERLRHHLAVLERVEGLP